MIADRAAVVPITRQGQLPGVPDIDSDHSDDISPIDVAGLQPICEWLAEWR